MSTTLRVEDGAASATPSMGLNKAYVIGGIVTVLLIGGGVVWYFFFRGKGNPPTPPDTPGDLKDWTSRSGYVGSLDPVSCQPGNEGLLCTNGNSYGVCRRLTQSPTAGEVACVTPGANDPQTGYDCAKSCHDNQSFRAMFHASDGPGSNKGSGPNFESNICLCYGQPKTLWDRCVLDKDDKGWTLWSTPDHQKDCDSTGIYAVPDIIKGIDGITPVEPVSVPSVAACQVEVNGRVNDDTLAYAVYDSKSRTCYVKTDDPSKNLFHDCSYDMRNSPVRGQYSLVSSESNIDKLVQNKCPNVKPITYYGQLPDYYLRATTASLAGVTNPGGADCSKACAVLDNNWGFPQFARPAFTWDGSTCTCYDFPAAKVGDLNPPKKDADVWRCAFWTEPKPEGKQLYVRNDPTDHLCPYDDPGSLPDELANCNHDGSIAPIGRNQHDKCEAPQSAQVCNQIWDGGDEGHYYCAYSDENWTPQGSNGMNCAGQCIPAPEICVDNATAHCRYATDCESSIYCDPDDAPCTHLVLARCKPWVGILGSPCGGAADCKKGRVCEEFKKQDGYPHDCKICQLPQ